MNLVCVIADKQIEATMEVTACSRRVGGAGCRRGRRAGAQEGGRSLVFTMRNGKAMAASTLHRCSSTHRLAAVVHGFRW